MDDLTKRFEQGHEFTVGDVTLRVAHVTPQRVTLRLVEPPQRQEEEEGVRAQDKKPVRPLPRKQRSPVVKKRAVKVLPKRKKVEIAPEPATTVLQRLAQRFRSRT